MATTTTKRTQTKTESSNNTDNTVWIVSSIVSNTQKIKKVCQSKEVMLREYPSLKSIGDVYMDCDRNGNGLRAVKHDVIV